MGWPVFFTIFSFAKQAKLWATPEISTRSPKKIVHFFSLLFLQLKDLCFASFETTGTPPARNFHCSFPRFAFRSAQNCFQKNKSAVSAKNNTLAIIHCYYASLFAFETTTKQSDCCLNVFLHFPTSFDYNGKTIIIRINHLSFSEELSSTTRFSWSVKFLENATFPHLPQINNVDVCPSKPKQTLISEIFYSIFTFLGKMKPAVERNIWNEFCRCWYNCVCEILKIGGERASGVLTCRSTICWLSS